MKDKKADKITYWKCERFQKDHCKDRLHVSNNTGQIIKTVDHRSDKAKVDADTVVGSIKRKALDSNENTVTRVRRTIMNIQEILTVQKIYIYLPENYRNRMKVNIF